LRSNDTPINVCYNLYMEHIMSEAINIIQSYLALALTAAATIMLVWPRKKKPDEMYTGEEPEFRLHEDRSSLLREEAAKLRMQRRPSPRQPEQSLKSMCAPFIYRLNFIPYYSGHNITRHIAKRFSVKYCDKRFVSDQHYSLRHLVRDNKYEFSRYQEELLERWKAS